MSIFRRGAARAAHPMLQLLDRRFGSLEHLVHAIKNELTERLDTLTAQSDVMVTSVSDQLTIQSTKAERTQASVDQLQAELHAVRDELGFMRVSLEAKLDAMAPSVRLRELTSSRLASIDQSASGFLNFANAHDGPLADAGLWLNNPVVIEWMEGSARIGAVNERVIEQPFAFAALCALPPGSSVLDIGGGESTVGFSLASLGYNVTVVEPQGYPFTHPNLTVITRPLEEIDFDEPFDGVLLLSAIEHFGIGHYRGNPLHDDRADLDAMTLVRNLVAPDGRLVLTTPFGPAETNDLERIYDDDGLRELLEGYVIDEIVIGRRHDATTWSVESTELAPPTGPGRVAMVIARPEATS